MTETINRRLIWVYDRYADQRRSSYVRLTGGARNKGSTNGLNNMYSSRRKPVVINQEMN